MTAKVTIHGYLPNGVAVDFSSDSDGYEWALQLSNDLIAAGMLITPPSMEGEQHETIGYVVRMEKISTRDGSPVPMIDLYYNHPDVQHKLLSIYLNTPEQVNEFETATGLRIGRIPLWEGNHIERGTNPKQDQYIVPVPNLPRIVWKENPKYNPEEPDAKKRKPKRLFVRWETSGSAAAQPNPEIEPEQAARNTAKTNEKGSKRNAASKPAQPPNASEMARKLIEAAAKWGLSVDDILQALRNVSAYEITTIDDFRGDATEAWVACVAFKVGYSLVALKHMIPEADNYIRQQVEQIIMSKQPF